MAFSKNEKDSIVKQYGEWVKKSQAIFILSYSKMTMQAIDDARAKLRETDAEIHVVKNRLFKRVLDENGLPYAEKFWEGNNIVTFVFDDAPGVAKTMKELTKGNDVFAVRAGYMDAQSASSGAGGCIGRFAHITRYACHVTGYDPGSCESIGANPGRTRPRPGCGGQSQYGKTTCGSVVLVKITKILFKIENNTEEYKKWLI